MNRLRNATMTLLGLMLPCLAGALPAPQALSLSTKDGWTSQATLQLPDGPGPTPVALIVPGFEDLDRDGALPGQAATDGRYARLALELAQNGVASLRFDKRGTGAAGGEHVKSFDTYVNDAEAWLSKLGGDPRFGKVAVIGHGEGALIGTLAARAAKADALIVIDGMGRNVLDVALDAVDSYSPKERRAAEKTLLKTLKSGDTSAVPAELADLYGPEQRRYILSWAKYDPAKELGKFKGAVLLLQGGQNDLARAADWAALTASQPKATQLVVKGMEYDLRDGAAAPNAAQLAPGLASSLANFIKSVR